MYLPSRIPHKILFQFSRRLCGPNVSALILILNPPIVGSNRSVQQIEPLLKLVWKRMCARSSVLRKWSSDAYQVHWWPRNDIVFKILDNFFSEWTVRGNLWQGISEWTVRGKLWQVISEWTVRGKLWQVISEWTVRGKLCKTFGYLRKITLWTFLNLRMWFPLCRVYLHCTLIVFCIFR